MDLESIDWLGLLGTVLLAILIVVATWVVAALAKWGAAKLFNSISVLKRQNQAGQSIGDSLATIAGLIVWIFGLVALLQLFGLSEVLAPLQNMLVQLLSFLPNLIGAGLVFFVGYQLAKVARELTITGLNGVGFDRRLAGWFGGSQAVQAPASQQFAQQGQPQQPGQPQQQGQQQPTGTSATMVLGNVVFGLIIALIGVAALQILGIQSLVGPTQQMLTTVLDALPGIAVAIALIVIGVVVANFVGKLLEPLLAQTGLDRAAANAGILSGERKLSSVLTLIARIAIVLFFAIMATQMLNFPQVTEILNEILRLGGNVLFGAVIIAAGFFIASLLKRIVGDGLVGKILYGATVVLFIAMGLQFMGLADSIINMAFGALVIGGAAAAALAFGLGGRDAAARTLAKVEASTERTVADERAADVQQETVNQPPTEPMV